MSAAHEPSMDEILRSIRRIIRSDSDEVQEPAIVAVPKKKVQRNKVNNEDNLIRMNVHEQKRSKLLEQRLEAMEAEYERKLAMHRDKMMEYRRRNHELTAMVEDYKSKLKLLANNLKSAHSCLEKLQEKNRLLKEKLAQYGRFDQGNSVLKAIQTEFVNLYHPDRVTGDQISKAVRHEIYNEFSQVLRGVRSRMSGSRV
jgi:hypothetical protein